MRCARPSSSISANAVVNCRRAAKTTDRPANVDRPLPRYEPRATFARSADPFIPHKVAWPSLGEVNNASRSEATCNIGNCILLDRSHLQRHYAVHNLAMQFVIETHVRTVRRLSGIDFVIDQLGIMPFPAEFGFLVFEGGRDLKRFAYSQETWHGVRWQTCLHRLSKLIEVKIFFDHKSSHAGAAIGMRNRNTIDRRF